MSTSKKGDELEIAVFGLLKSEIDAGRFFAKKKCCRIFRKKAYYSKDRESDIVFDVSIEISLPGAEDYSVLVLIECKNYGHPVPVDDIEEFFIKTQQVGAANTKAIAISNNSFQAGALTFAKSKKMGLARYFAPQELKWELRRSASAALFDFDDSANSEVFAALNQEGYRSSVFDFFMQSPNKSTNALWDFFEDLIFDADIDRATFRAIHNSKGRQGNLVPFLQKSEIETFAESVLASVAYEEGFVNLEKICTQHPTAANLTVERHLTADVEYRNAPLGRLSFEPLKLELFGPPGPNVGRYRFTFAHELAHLLLGHGQYMRREFSDETDYRSSTRVVDTESDITRMEYQANYFAACLLMPRESFVTDFVWELRRLDLHDKGFGALYVDSQECNVANYMSVTNRLMKFYGASRAAVSIRLKGLGLLRDVRRTRPTQAPDNSTWFREGEDDQDGPIGAA
ncbi:MAG: ImmA/IrrE family metallo-endopeptidase [Burkholderiaceae bacterium]|nr:ImmA/IrrE family metallo-endopeptidase [Burkholderiaceae bacterium]